MKTKLFFIKKVLFVLCILSVAGAVPLHQATAVDAVLDEVVVTPDAGFTALAPIPGLTDKPITDSKGFADFFNKLYAYLIGAAVILAVIMIVWGGLEYSTQDSVSKKSDGKSKIYNALFGLVLVLSPALVFSIINPRILQLDVNFPPLHTTWGDYTGSKFDSTTIGSSGESISSVKCGSDGCSGQVANCTSTYTYTTKTCIGADGSKKDLVSGVCKSGDTFECTIL